MTLANGYSMGGVMWYVSLYVFPSSHRICMLIMLQVLPYDSYSVRHGGYERYAAQFAVALG
jgi:hypothetical protein